MAKFNEIQTIIESLPPDFKTERIKAVSAWPEIALITTGSELVEPGEKPGKGKIRNSNAHQITAQLQQMGLLVNYMGLASDDYDILTQLFEEAFQKNDIVFFTGGASVGDFDWIPRLLKEQGFVVHWDKTGMKPGNPQLWKYPKEHQVLKMEN